MILDLEPLRAPGPLGREELSRPWFVLAVSTVEAQTGLQPYAVGVGIKIKLYFRSFRSHTHSHTASPPHRLCRAPRVPPAVAKATISIMALVTAWRALAGARNTLARAAASTTWPAHTTAAPPPALPVAVAATAAASTSGSVAAALHTSAAPAADGPGQGGPPDPFTASLQSKAEQDLLALLQRQISAQQAAATAASGEQEQSDSDGEGESDVNRETGAAAAGSGQVL
jgi:hypothetical protein